jgi:hypothetical protein
MPGGRLRSVKREDPEWAEAKQVVPRLEACRKRIGASLSKGLQEIMITQREAWARNAEKTMLDQGMVAGWPRHAT